MASFVKKVSNVQICSALDKSNTYQLNIIRNVAEVSSGKEGNDTPPSIIIPVPVPDSNIHSIVFPTFGVKDEQNEELDATARRAMDHMQNILLKFTQRSYDDAKSRVVPTKPTFLYSHHVGCYRISITKDINDLQNEGLRVDPQTKQFLETTYGNRSFVFLHLELDTTSTTTCSYDPLVYIHPVMNQSEPCMFIPTMLDATTSTIWDHTIAIVRPSSTIMNYGSSSRPDRYNVWPQLQHCTIREHSGRVRNLYEDGKPSICDVVHVADVTNFPELKPFIQEVQTIFEQSIYTNPEKSTLVVPSNMNYFTNLILLRITEDKTKKVQGDLIVYLRNSSASASLSSSSNSSSSTISYVRPKPTAVPVPSSSSEFELWIQEESQMVPLSSRISGTIFVRTKTGFFTLESLLNQ